MNTLLNVFFFLEGYEIGVAAIVGIVVAIMFVILIVSILIFAKLNGRWCFSGKYFFSFR